MSDKPKAHPLLRAWAGGVFDARIQIPRNGYQLRLESTDKLLIERFHEVMGVGTLAEMHKPQCAHPVWIYRTNNMDDCRTVLLTVSPFIGAVRTKQASEMIAKIERNGIWIKNNPEKATSLKVASPAKDAEAKTT